MQFNSPKDDDGDGDGFFFEVDKMESGENGTGRNINPDRVPRTTRVTERISIIHTHTRARRHVSLMSQPTQQCGRCLDYISIYLYIQYLLEMCSRWRDVECLGHQKKATRSSGITTHRPKENPHPDINFDLIVFLL